MIMIKASNCPGLTELPYAAAAAFVNGGASPRGFLIATQLRLDEQLPQG